MDCVNIITLSSDNGDEQDIFVKSISSNKLNDHDSTLIIRATNGMEVRSSIQLSHQDIIHSKAPSNTLTDEEWASLVSQSLFNTHPTQEDRDKYKVFGQEMEGSNSEGSWEIKIAIESHKLRNVLGSFTLERPQTANPEDYDAFLWSISLQKARDESQRKTYGLKARVTQLELQNRKIIEEQKRLQEQLQEKQLHQLKVFSRILNEQQKRYRDLTKEAGVKDPSEPLININYIKHKDEEIRNQELLAEQKPKRQKKATDTATNSGPTKKDTKTKLKPKQTASLVRKTPTTSPKKPNRLSPIKATDQNTSIIRGINHLKSNINSTSEDSFGFQFTNVKTENPMVVPLSQTFEMEGEEIKDEEIAESTDGDEDNVPRNQDKEIVTDIDEEEEDENDGDEGITETDDDNDLKSKVHLTEGIALKTESDSNDIEIPESTVPQTQISQRQTNQSGEHNSNLVIHEIETDTDED